MSDFKKNPDPAPTDDMAPVPVTPFSIGSDVPAIEEDQSEDDVTTLKEGAPFWHPAWETVQKKFEEQIGIYADNNALVYKDLEPFDFKVRMTSEAVVAEILTKIMEDVKRAVESIESRPKPAKQPKSGA